MLRRLATLALTVFALGAAPAHVQTADYWAGYAGTKSVSPQTAARWLTWAETDIAGSRRIHPFGVKTMLYTDPARQLQGEPLYDVDESAFAHDCSGHRVEAVYRPGQYVMDPHSPALRDKWKAHVERYAREGMFDAIFADDQANLRFVHSQPCNANRDDWIRATNDLQKSLGRPVIYNALEVLDNPGIAPELALNRTAIGGMMERCYSESPRVPRVGDRRWEITEDTEIRMAAEKKTFFCYNNDTEPAAAAADARLYVYASFLLTYDPSGSVLWEYYGTPSGAHVMPEVQFVPLDPLRTPHAIADLRNGDGVYVRAFRHCAFAGSEVGSCAVVVNSSGDAKPVKFAGFSRTLSVQGDGIFDGGRATLRRGGLPRELDPYSAVIAVR